MTVVERIFDTILALTPIVFLLLLLCTLLTKVPLKNLTITTKSYPSDDKNSTQPLLTKEVYISGYERPHPELCPNLGAKLSLLILIPSSPVNRLARNAIRKTWGHYAFRSDISIAFIIGTSLQHLKRDIDEEDELYGDIIVGRFIDTYKNLTLKTLSILEWIDVYCPKVPKLLKCDDDMFINVPRLLEFIKAPSRVNATKTIWGNVVKKSLPNRSKRSKYFVSRLQYPDTVFPDYMTGPAYLLTTDVTKDILAAAPNELYLTVEDVFVTGLIASKLGIKRQHASEFSTTKTLLPCAVKKLISIHMMAYYEQFDLWTNLLDGTMQCADKNNNMLN